MTVYALIDKNTAMIAKKRKFGGGRMIYPSIRTAKAARTNTGRLELVIGEFEFTGVVSE